MRKLIGIAVAVVLTGLSVSAADAQQYMSYSVSRSWQQSPAVNNYLSQRYDYLLQTNWTFRRYRMWKECHTINLVPLHGDCLASFDQYEPMLVAYRG